MTKTEDSAKTKNGHDFLVVGIGASAGGIKALTEFFTLMPPDSGMAFVVILHLSEEHKSTLAEILQRQTTMPVQQVTTTTKVQPNNVYVIPPGKHLEMLDGSIGLRTPEHVKGVRVPIDRFFRTLADAYTTQAVCIIMSGTGTDGTIGMKQIKERAGFAIVQDPLDAEYDGMPRSAIETQIADIVLHVAEMPEKLLFVRDTTAKFGLANGNEQKPEKEIKNIEVLRDVLALLRVRTGNDFASYKRPTLIRRIARHLQIHETDDLAVYLDILRENPEEVASLIKNLLINVTNFFRDKEAFAAIEKKIIPAIFANKTRADNLRVWSAGCASGEEPYSIAMLLSEYAATLPDPPSIQVFASDVDDDAIASAREGRFTEASVVDVPPHRLQQFFVKEDGQYRIRKQIREMVLFAPHNLLRDPPFSKIDLVICRNVLIYLNRETQEKLFQVFHFALRENGYLFLGSSESIDSKTYTPINKKHRIYQARPKDVMWAGLSPIPVSGSWEPRPIQAPAHKFHSHLQSFGELHHRLIEQYAAPSVLVNEDADILHLSETAGQFLNFVGGTPSNNLLKVIVPSLLSDLRGSLFAAKRDQQPVEAKNIPVSVNGVAKRINLTVRPVAIPEAAALVMFEEAAGDAPEGGAVKAVIRGRRAATESVVRGLEDELKHIKEQLRNTIEQYETSNEEQKASNEELQAINEELRSASEELETSKEELQSLNEELTTVNHELKDKVDELSRVNSDLLNLMQSSDIGTIFLDRDLNIKRFTTSVADIFNIIQSDIGRPLSHVTNQLVSDDLTNESSEVLRSLKTLEHEIESSSGKSFLVRLSPYRSVEDKIEGVVLAFIDITERKKVEARLRQTEERMRLIVGSAKDYAIFTADCERIITDWNVGAEAMFGYTESEIVGKSGDILFTAEDRSAGVPQKEEANSLKFGRAENERWHAKKDGSLFYGSGLAMALRNDAGERIGYVKIMRDLTIHKRSEEALGKSEEQFRRSIEEAPIPVIMHAEDGTVLQISRTWTELTGYTVEDMATFDAWLNHAYGEGADAVRLHMEELFKGERTSLNIDFPVKTRAGEKRDWSFSASSPGTLHDGRRFIVGMAIDITERKQMEEAVKKSHDELEDRVEERTAELAEAGRLLARESAEREEAQDERLALLKKILTVQEDERRRIARDMHDHFGQQLTAMRLNLNVVQKMADDEALKEKLGETQRLAESLDSDVSFGSDVNSCV